MATATPLDIRAQRPAHAVHFAPDRAFHLLALSLMVLAIGAGLARYFGWLIGIIMGLALSYVFSALTTTLLAPAGAVSHRERLLAGLFSLTLFGVTMGLSYGTLYASLFAHSSALGEFTRVRAPIERQLESSVLANAEAAIQAFGAWEAYSANKAKQEGGAGGTCPGRAASLGVRGPIAMWREADAGIAANLHSELTSTVHSLRRQFEQVKLRRASNFAEVSAISSSLNRVIEGAEALARGSYVAATQATLARQLASNITWPGGEVFRCGDTARDELILRAQAALMALGDPQKNPPIKPLAPAIDLNNQQELTIRGLLRAFNAIGIVASFGLVGNFVDDPLMEMALKTKGVINRETLGFFIAGLIELCVLVTGFLAARSGSMPFPYRPTDMLADYDRYVEQKKNGLSRWIARIGLAGCKTLLNLFFTRPGQRIEPLGVTRTPETRYDQRELDWAEWLAPYLMANHAGEYLVIPHGGNYAKALLAAQALEYQKLAVRLNLDVTWDTIAHYWPVTSRFATMLPNVYELHYAIFKLMPDFAQAIRLQLLKRESGAHDAPTAAVPLARRSPLA